jgi:hypothetical protein
MMMEMKEEEMVAVEEVEGVDDNNCSHHTDDANLLASWF